ncbi:transglutaminaseTgpA domain-containing protein [Pseudaquabacterium rugosum]|uniref:TransglutaminaseTgpA domain-containing protein n=1 Tax=Pseudaquabacterium rugosum TaxID=2984194 RepID=A0ABU9BA19_9BURK
MNERRTLHRWLGLTLLLALGPAAAVLPARFALLLALPLLAAVHGLRRQAAPLGRRAHLLLSLVCLAGWAWIFQGRWRSAAAVIGFLALVLALKWLERAPQRLQRDTLILLLGACVLGALGAVHHVAAVGLAALGLMVCALVATLAALHGAARPGRVALRLVAGALPLAALLFLLMPRVPGPLWDIGLGVGLPLGLNVPRGSAGLGGEARLQPGGPRSQRLEDGTVLVARFDGYRPPASQLYWRGPVLARFDGRQWLPAAWWGERGRQMAAGHRRAAAWRASVDGRGSPLRYHLRVAAHGQHWLYGLDLPASLPAESYLSRDWQLLSMTPLREESSYTGQAWLDWREREPRLSDADREEALDWPADPQNNPRLRALGRQLAAGAADERVRLARVLAHFDRAHYRLDGKAVAHPGPALYDHFVFDDRAGSADQYAGAFVLLARAAGLPARLVTGYRGGRLMGATDYVLVKQSHAHAWAEVWLSGHGWTRADPADAVSAPRERTPAGSAEPTAGRAPAAPPPAARTPAGPDTPTAHDPWRDALDRWVLHYDAERRDHMLQAIGPLRSAAPLHQGLLLLIGLPALALAAHAAWRRRQQARQAPWRRGWQLLVRRLAAVGLHTEPGDCPSRLLERLQGRPEPWAGVAAPLVRTWIDWHYGEPAPMRLAPGATPATARAIAAGRDWLRQVQRFRPQAFRSVR